MKQITYTLDDLTCLCGHFYEDNEVSYSCNHKDSPERKCLSNDCPIAFDTNKSKSSFDGDKIMKLLPKSKNNDTTTNPKKP